MAQGGAILYSGLENIMLFWKISKLRKYNYFRYFRCFRYFPENENF